MNTTSKKLISAVLLASMLTATACSSKDSKNVGTPESTVAPAASVDGLFPTGDKSYFVPFQDPEHSYCTISEGLGTPVREQKLGGCYCYSAVTDMQSNYLKVKGELVDINPYDIISRIYESPDPTGKKTVTYDEEKYYVTGGNVTDYGGDVERVTGALCADPLNGFLISESNIFGSYNCDVEGLYRISEDELKTIVRKYGAVSVSCNYTKGCKTVNGYHTQNFQNNAKNYNHVVSIVGWDDNFPADCFEDPASRNGAWLAQNSFGEIWGNSGYYWISYDMAIHEIYNCNVTKEYKSAVSYGRFPREIIPSSDLLDITGRNIESTELTLDAVNGCNNVTGATVYDVKGTIGAIGFWTDAPGQPYEIEILDGEFGDVLATKSGSFDYAGYHTVRLDSPIKVKKFTVVVKTAGLGVFEGESSETKVYAILNTYPAHYEAKTKPGRSFVKAGDEWVDVTAPDVMSRLGLKDVPAFKDAGTVGDPCITVLFV